ncbi:MAG: hypothetical protein Q9O62_03545 [Ardenticatenia bacterium]|nr:hypothetical protein [Ardenticatenia bacterium]
MVIQSAHVAVFTDVHIFRGIVLTGRRRVSDMLNDSMSQYIELEDVQVYSVLRPTRSVREMASAYVSKRNCLFVAVLREEFKDPLARFFAYVERVAWPGILYVGAYEIHGTLFFKTKQESKGPLVRPGESFLPVAKALVYSMLNPRVQVRAPVVLVRDGTFSAFFYEEAQ